MRAAMYYANDDVRIVDLPKPRIGPGEILVKVRSSGICGSDVMEWYRRPKAPLVLGHEIAAEVVEVGTGVNRVKIGDRVFVSHHVPCGECRYCFAGHETVCDTLRTTNVDPGGFAEFVRVPAINVRNGVVTLPETLSDEEAVFIEPLACVVRGQRLAELRPASTVLVIGNGIAGLLHIKVAKLIGAKRIFATDIVEYRLKAAKKMGADTTIDGHGDVPARVREANHDDLVDYVITCTGSSNAISQGLASVNRGGTVLLFAPVSPGTKVEFPLNSLWRDEAKVVSSYAAGQQDIQKSIEILTHRRINVTDLVSHVLRLSDAAEAFRIVAAAGNSLKVVLRP